MRKFLLGLSFLAAAAHPALATRQQPLACESPQRLASQLEEASAVALEQHVVAWTLRLEEQIRAHRQRIGAAPRGGIERDRLAPSLRGSGNWALPLQCVDAIRQAIHALALAEPAAGHSLVRRLDLLDHRLGTLQLLAAGADLPALFVSRRVRGGTGSISGAVSDADGGAPILGVEIDLFDSQGGFVAYATTDGAGGYDFAGLVAGDYFARSFSTTFLNELYDDIPCFSGCSVATATPISVSAATTAAGIDFELSLGGTIAGTITQEAGGAPIPSASVRVYDASGGWVGVGFSNADGEFEATGLPAGTLFARSASRFLDELYDDLPCAANCLANTGAPIAVTLGTTIAGIDFALAAGGSISGTVTDEVTGNSIDSAFVTSHDNLGNTIGFAFPDAEGHYLLTGLPAGDVFVQARDGERLDELYDDIVCVGTCDVTVGTPIPIRGVATTTGIDFALAAGGSISGTVTEAATGDPIPGTSVSVLDAFGRFVTSVGTDGLGAYTASGIPGGNVFVVTSVFPRVVVDEIYNDIPCVGCSVSMGTPVAVSAGKTTTGIDFDLEPFGSISGRVTEDAGGAAIEGIFVQLRDRQGRFVESGFSDGKGRYSFSEVARGSYHALTFSGFADELFDGIPCPTGQCNLASGTEVGVASGVDTDGIDFALARAGFLSGIVTDAATARPLGSVAIHLFDNAGTLVLTRVTGFTGQYFAFGLLAGRYFATTSNLSGFVDQLYDGIPCAEGDCDPTTGVPIVVQTDEQTQGVDFELEVPGSIFHDGFESGNVAAWSVSSGGGR